MGKTSKKEETQQIDPMLRAETEANMGLARMFASLGYQPYRGTDVAAFTPQERAAMDMSDEAAGAFGFEEAGYGGPTGEKDIGNNISGWNTQEIMEREQPNIDFLQDFMRKFADKAGTPTPHQAPLKPSSGGKK